MVFSNFCEAENQTEKNKITHDKFKIILKEKIKVVTYHNKINYEKANNHNQFCHQFFFSSFDR